jgi:hypothetical protein
MNDGSNVQWQYHEEGCEYVEYLNRQEKTEQESKQSTNEKEENQKLE